MICAALCENLHFSQTDGNNSSSFIASAGWNTRRTFRFISCEQKKRKPFLFIHFDSRRFWGSASLFVLKNAYSILFIAANKLDEIFFQDFEACVLREEFRKDDRSQIGSSRSCSNLISSISFLLSFTICR